MKEIHGNVFCEYLRFLRDKKLAKLCKINFWNLKSTLSLQRNPSL